MKKLILLSLLLNLNASAMEFFQNQVLKRIPEFTGHTSFGDLNGDGYKDIFVSEFHYFNCFSFECANPIYIDSEAEIYINDKKGGFAKLELETSIVETNIVPINNGFWEKITSYTSTIADVNNDGHNDIITSDGRTLINNGNAQFHTQIFVGIGSSNHSVYTEDFDNDGILEIFSNGKIKTRIQIDPLLYSSDNSISFSTEKEVKFADFNNDGFKDIVTYGDDSNIVIYINNQAGKFSTNNKIILNDVEKLSLVVGDVDGDAKVDLILSDKSVLKNLGDFSFQKIPESISFDARLFYFETPTNNFINIDLVNYNTDEFPDLLIRTYDREDVGYNDSSNQAVSYYVLFNNGEGKFSEHDNYKLSLISNGADLVIAEDFNNDSYEDFIISYAEIYAIKNANDDVSYLKNFFTPAASAALNLHISKPQASINVPSLESRAMYSSYLKFDINNDGINEYISKYFRNIYMHTFNDFEIGYKPHYLSDLSLDGLIIKELELFDDQLRDYKNIIKGDLNNDGLDDLLISYYECNPICESPKSTVFFNSEAGLSNNDRKTYDFIIKNYGGIIDFDGDGINDIFDIYFEVPYDISSQKIKVIKFNQSHQVDNSYEFDISELGSSFYVADLNNDTKADLFYISENKPHILFGDDSISTLGSGVEVTNDFAFQYKLYDIDNDGDLDLLTNKNNSKVVSRYLNDGHGNFQSILPLNFPRDIYLFNVEIADLDNDSRIEFILNDFNSGYSIFQNTSNSDYAEIYTTPEIDELNGLYQYDLMEISRIIDDFDQDEKMDIFLGKYLTYFRDFSFQTGLNYDPQHSGHGFSIENVGEDLFYTVFYTYDNNSYPEWFSDVGLFEKPQADYWYTASLGDQLINYHYDYETNSTFQNTEVEFMGHLEHSNCSDKYGDISLDFSIGINGFGIPLTDQWCSNPIVGYYQQPQNDLSGLWWAGGEDSGWGWSVSLVEREDTTEMVVVLYYYDGQGHPRWLIGQQSGFVAGEEISLYMNMVKGYRRSATPVPLELIPAGTMTLTLNQASNNLNQGGRMSIDVTYPGPQGGSWLREDVPIALFSTPRN